MQEKMGGVTEMAVDAMSKEIKFESLAEKEEIEREKMEDNENRARLEAMKAKEECLERDQAKLGANDRAVLQETNLANQIKEMKESIKNMIMNQRAK